MPHIALPITPDGPIVTCDVSPSNVRRAALTASGAITPNPVRVRLLVDTGAESTCLDPAVVRRLGLQATGLVPVLTPTTGSTAQIVAQYDAALYLSFGSTSRAFDPLPILESQLSPQGIDGLLGRDVLEDCLLVYSGPNSLFILSI